MDSNEIQEEKKLPFNNLFLNAGFINGQNEWWMYVFGICAAMLGYFIFQLVMVLPLISAAISNGITFNEIQTNPEILFNPDKTGINKTNPISLLLYKKFILLSLELLLPMES